MNAEIQITSQPLVSIAMPFYNSENTLGLALQSLLRQSYRNLEILLCDDGSSDRGMEIVRSFNDSRIVAWRDGERKNLARRLNECIDLSRGQYFARMDADDVAFPERIECQVRFLQSHPEIDLVSANATVFGKDGAALGKKSGPTRHEDIVRFPLLGFRMWHPTWVGKMLWFRKWRYWEEAALGQDQELLFRAHRQSRYANLEPMLLGYRQEELRLRKMVRYRWLGMRSVRRNLTGISVLTQMPILATLNALKVAADCAAVWTGLKYRLLRRRARPLSNAEVERWRVFWSSLNAPNLVNIKDPWPNISPQLKPSVLCIPVKDHSC